MLCPVDSLCYRQAVVQCCVTLGAGSSHKGLWTDGDEGVCSLRAAVGTLS